MEDATAVSIMSNELILKKVLETGWARHMAPDDSYDRSRTFDKSRRTCRVTLYLQLSMAPQSSTRSWTQPRKHLVTESLNHLIAHKTRRSIHCSTQTNPSGEVRK